MKAIESADIILMQLEIPIETVEYVAELGASKGKKVILNPAPAQALSMSLLRNIDIIVPNKSEAEILSGIKVTDAKSAKKAAEIISKKGVDNVVITLGSQGALILEKNIYHLVPAHVVEAIDTTAAGDTFCGSLCFGLANQKSLLDAVKLAVKASAITVTRMGAQSSHPYYSELSLIE